MPRSFLARKDFAAALLELGVVGERQRLVEDRREVAGVVGRADRGLVRDRLARNEIAPPQPDRIDAGDARRLVDEALQRVVRFRPPRAAIRSRRHRVGEHALHVDLDARDRVHAGKAAREIVGLDVRAGRADERAHAGDVLHAQRQEFALLVDGEFGLGDGVARLLIGKERLRARRHPGDRPSGELRGDEQARILGIARGLQPECAADILGDDTQLFLRPAHHGDELVALRARALRAGAQRVVIVLASYQAVAPRGSIEATTRR